MEKKELDIIKGTTEELLQQLGITAEVIVQEAETGIEIVLQTSESGILIGYHGETLEALQLMLSLMVSKKLDKFLRISIEIGEYKKNRTDYLRYVVEQTKQRVLAEQKEVPLPNLKSWERRIVHLMLQQDQDVVSESTGEGRERVLVIKPKK